MSKAQAASHLKIVPGSFGQKLAGRIKWSMEDLDNLAALFDRHPAQFLFGVSGVLTPWAFPDSVPPQETHRFVRQAVTR